MLQTETGKTYKPGAPNSSILLHQAENLRKIANGELNITAKAELAQFMTPASVSSFMASLFPVSGSDKLYLLDLGSGVGSLTAAFLAQIKQWHTVRHVSIDAYEIDEIMLRHLSDNLKSCKDDFSASNLAVDFQVVNRDFIVSATDIIFNKKSLWAEGEYKYTHCIMNPPYRKISSSSRHRKLLNSVGIETVNLYSAFTALALTLLCKNGWLVAIIPRSFCNGGQKS